jgi:general stress protein 26
VSKKLRDVKAEIWRLFENCQPIFLATVETEQPRVRPVSLVNFDRRLWVLTGTDSAKTSQISKNPKIEFCLPFKEGEHNGYIRASGSARIIKDKEIKIRVAKHCDFFDQYWKSPDDPNFTLLELKLNEIEYLGPDEEIARKFKL